MTMTTTTTRPRSLWYEREKERERKSERDRQKQRPEVGAQLFSRWKDKAPAVVVNPICLAPDGKDLFTSACCTILHCCDTFLISFWYTVWLHLQFGVGFENLPFSFLGLIGQMWLCLHTCKWNFAVLNCWQTLGYVLCFDQPFFLSIFHHLKMLINDQASNQKWRLFSCFSFVCTKTFTSLIKHPRTEICVQTLPKSQLKSPAEQTNV